jgi:hypothetical protein
MHMRIPQEFISSSERRLGSAQVSYYTTQAFGDLTVNMLCEVQADCDERCNDPEADEAEADSETHRDKADD